MAERLGRRWIGIETFVKAYEPVKQWLTKETADPTDILKYKNEIYLKTDPPVRTDQGIEYREQKWVYIISYPNFPGEYKVGIAKNPASRLNQYQTRSPERVYKTECKHQTSWFRQTESHVHDRFNNKREWVTGRLSDIVDAIKQFRPFLIFYLCI